MTCYRTNEFLQAEREIRGLVRLPRMRTSLATERTVARAKASCEMMRTLQASPEHIAKLKAQIAAKGTYDLRMFRGGAVR